MNVKEAIRTRKSVRKYTDKPVEDEILNQIFESARLAPSANNMQEWRFVVVREAATRQKLAEIANNQVFIAEAGAVIVACADTDEQYMPCGQQSYPIDAAIVLDHITLAAVELGLGTCWVASFEEKPVKKLLGIPEKIRIVAMMPLGYPADGSPVEKNRLPIKQILKYERW